jgi:GNAT superfamily N-acetyltransferase
VKRQRMHEVRLEKVDAGNLSVCGIGCLTDPKNQGYQPRVAWLKQRFAEGLRFLLCRDEKGKPLAFLEYVPGEYAWRPVDAKGWLFIHCLWVYPAGQKVGGLGSRLIRACIEEARQAGAQGVATLASDGAWMAGKDVFLRNGFEEIAEVDRFQLLIHRLKQGPAPRFRDISGNPAKYQGLHIVYSAQCPMLPKSVNDLSIMAAEHGLEVKVTMLNSAREAQNAPSYYGVFALVWIGRLLSDHYVSKGRFSNILRKEIRKEEKHGGKDNSV